MIKTLIFLLFFISCNSSPCEPCESELKTILNVMYSKKILEEYQEVVNLKIVDEIDIVIPEEIHLHKKNVKIESEVKGIPLIVLSNIKSNDVGLTKIDFIVFKAAKRFRGEIVFKCVEEKMIFKDIHYLSEID